MTLDHRVTTPEGRLVPTLAVWFEDDGPGMPADVLRQAGLSLAEVEDMYRIMAIANYEDRFVIPTTHREYAEDAFDLRGSCGFSFGNAADENNGGGLFGVKRARRRVIPIKEAS